MDLKGYRVTPTWPGLPLGQCAVRISIVSKVGEGNVFMSLDILYGGYKYGDFKDRNRHVGNSSIADA